MTTTVTVSHVLDKTGTIIGFEFEIAGGLYFYSSDQQGWPGLRAGRFPCDSDGAAFARNVVYTNREAPAPAQVLEGSRLTVARCRRGLSQSELAAKIGVKEKKLRAWEEKQEWCEDKEIILKLAWVLKFPVGFFTGPEIELLDPKRISFRR